MESNADVNRLGKETKRLASERCISKMQIGKFAPLRTINKIIPDNFVQHMILIALTNEAIADAHRASRVSRGRFCLRKSDYVP